ncbi:MAG TPA: hypothetical protein DGG94_13005 [Micromonosporaceae bacterium]|nr:hypothetical protein [Micromonosporaceae bacterium]HCU50699.1 hypothetical protein [Micromonosporaceae bacterium]
MTRDPVTGQISRPTDFSTLKSGDRITVTIDGWQRPIAWEITIISVDPMCLHRQHEVWITGIANNMRCRVLVRDPMSPRDQASEIAKGRKQK